MTDERIRERWATARWAWCDGPASSELAAALGLLADPGMTARLAALPRDIRQLLTTLNTATRSLLILVDQAGDDVPALLAARDQAERHAAAEPTEEPPTPPITGTAAHAWWVFGNTLYIGHGPGDWIAFPGDVATAQRIAAAHNIGVDALQLRIAQLEPAETAEEQARQAAVIAEIRGLKKL